MKRDFDAAAKTWDKDDTRTRMSLAIADAMVDSLCLTGSETVLDYGTGTGTVAFRFQPHVKQVIAADSSPGMLAVLADKLKTTGAANVSTRVIDLEREPAPAIDPRPDVVVSAMTLHHIVDTGSFALALHRILPAGGRIALADLDTEDGTFHSDNTGVEHFGFDREALTQVFSTVGFADVQTQTAYEIKRPTTTGGERAYSIFLLTARRNDSEA